MPAFDVDIDFPSTFNSKDYFPLWTKASILKDEKLRPHPCGIYPQKIAIDPITKLAAIPYKQAEDTGYFKLDMLHLHVYNHFESRQEMLDLLDEEPKWDLLLLKSNVEKLFQISNHFELVSKLRPKSIEELADLNALIRPGKKDLIPIYLAHKEKVRAILYSQGEAFSFKRSHAISYAMVIVLQLHLIDLGLL
jgi:hypothetical protein